MAPVFTRGSWTLCKRNVHGVFTWLTAVFHLVADIVRKLAALEFVRPTDKEHIHMSTHTRLRPLGKTSGSDQRPARELTGAAMKFDVGGELATLQQELSWRRGDRN